MRPSAEQQLEFLQKILRLFSEGAFSATYKYALIMAFTELAIELGDDSGNPLCLPNTKIGEKFIDIYWQQVTPFPTQEDGVDPGILSQNFGAQATIVNAIEEFRSLNTRLDRSSPEYRTLASRVTNTVVKQPLKFLQNFDGATDSFLYERDGRNTVLNTGVAFNLRQFSSLIQSQAQRHWVEHIRRNDKNRQLLGRTPSIDQFLFETERETLRKVANELEVLQNQRCFYCQKTIRESRNVDHFIPFSLYPRDTMHNFVLTHSSCNSQKSDTLAARNHLERWIEHIQSKDKVLSEIGERLEINTNLPTTRSIAHWAYKNAVSNGSSGWVKKKEFESLDRVCLSEIEVSDE